MHKLNVKILGPSSFVSTLNELKIYLKFNPSMDGLNDNPIAILFHIDALQDVNQKNYIDSKDSIKICVGKKNELKDNFDANLELPTTLKEINAIIENTIAKKKFNKNSSIIIKDYLLNKNEKKLSKSSDFIILTEKEVQLLELFLNSKKPLSKDRILSLVWNYSSDADTHTVETHIYRLRKKINEKFMDQKFILNNKNGYFL
ncbi:MAG: winged helix-turn-helix domain-containing protein, partial [Pseudomonadota bacterium]|nr:winged helix-turn-helix domain-containing protein [Pseudomonadota bacterium]